MYNIPLFNEFVTSAPDTESIKYAGSKLKILPYILQMIRRIDVNTILDGFSGTTRVSQALAKSGYNVICNDKAIWSKVLGTCYLLANKPPETYQPLISYLNALQPINGWFTEHYGGYPKNGCSIQLDGYKKPWQIHNTRKLDAIREEIDSLNLDCIDKAVALTSLMLALDRVDNTLGHYASYLAFWSPRSYETMQLKVPAIIHPTNEHIVHQRDILDLVPEIKVDLAYFDPPYGSSNNKMPPSRVRYSAYYHIWQSVCLNDKPPLFGKANRRKDSSDKIVRSDFEEFRRSEDGKFFVLGAIDKLIRETQAQWIILSYSSTGRITSNELDEILRANGKLIDVTRIDHRRNTMANMKWSNKWVNESEKENREFLFLLEK